MLPEILGSAAAADRLAYVHLDDNDGESDLHWSLQDGVLTAEVLAATLAALGSSPYTGPVSLELNPQLPDPLAALKKSRDLVLTHLQKGLCVRVVCTLLLACTSSPVTAARALVKYSKTRIRYDQGLAGPERLLSDSYIGIDTRYLGSA